MRENKLISCGMVYNTITTITRRIEKVAIAILRDRAGKKIYDTKIKYAANRSMNTSPPGAAPRALLRRAKGTVIPALQLGGPCVFFLNACLVVVMHDEA